ncbi:MAG: hypothetical protein WA913_07405 [Pricia sp.]
MKRRYKITTIVMLALLAGGCCLYLFYYETFPMDMSARKTDVRISSDRLADSFDADEIEANAQFVEKTIEVVGSVKKITQVNDRYTVLLQGQDGLSNVICDILPSSIGEAKALRPGQTVRLKGICKGYLMDVILLNCILINDRTDG